ncbi:hypothetical protein [Persicirhabdus sediminis]|uniref:Uncharacterized protein n=1 Tax=Persicirhabdus sediminis TaxID=454144 RepID=A0A8J7MAM4_9BACT|nr:hypothetical protein [Persicirhabdus sediminis]MBK1789533.1 hypothetical protein [Persicirhabdus sediminis]
MKITPKRIGFILTTLLFVVAGLGAYLKLCVFGWKEEWSLAVGIVRMKVPFEDDAKVLSRFTYKLSTGSTAEIELESGMITDPPWADESEGHSVRLMLDGHGVNARGYLRFDPLRIEYVGPNEDAEVFQQIVDLAQSRGVAGPIEIVEINTPINVVTKR